MTWVKVGATITVPTPPKGSLMETIQLPQSVFTHPRGYDFYLAMEEAATPMEQLAVVKEYAGDVVDPSILLGNGTRVAYEVFRDERDADNAAPDFGILPVEYRIHLLQDADQNYVLWLLDEDGLYVGVRYGVPANMVFEKAREIYYLARVATASVAEYEEWKSNGAQEAEFLASAVDARNRVRIATAG